MKQVLFRVNLHEHAHSKSGRTFPDRNILNKQRNHKFHRRKGKSVPKIIMRVFLLGSILSGAVAFGVVSPLVVTAQDADGPAGQFRTMTITSEPGATVWLNGIRYGRTDKAGKLTFKTAMTGARTLRVRANGFKEKSMPLTAASRDEIAMPLVKTEDAAELAFQEAERLTSEDREKSAEAYRRAIKARPNFPDAYLGLARVLIETGDYDAAAKALAGARRLKPGWAEASAVEGRLQKEAGEESRAITAYKRAITEGKGFQPEAYAGLGILYKEKAEGFGGSGDFTNEAANYAEASKYLKASLKQLSGAPDTLVIYQLLGLIYERQKMNAEAIKVYEEFLRLFPDSTDASAVRSFIVQLRKDMATQ